MKKVILFLIILLLLGIATIILQRLIMTGMGMSGVFWTGK